MSGAWPMSALREVAVPVNRPETPVAGTLYRQIGVRLWGHGAYERESIDGGQTKYGTLSRVKAGDIIVNKIWARNGSVAVVPDELDGCYASNEFPTFVPVREKLYPGWFHWLTKTRGFWQQCDEKARGTSGKNRIRPEKFLDILFPLPDEAEQRRIVARIEELAARIQEAQGLQRNTVEDVAMLSRSTRARAFRQAAKAGTTPLNDAATLERGRFSHRPRNDPYFFGGDHPWIQIGEIEASDKYVRTWTETLNDTGLAVSRKFAKGTVLISIAATIGAVAILGFDCCVPDSIVAVTPRPQFDREFVYHYLCFLRSHLEEVAPQSEQKNINLRILSALPIPNVPIREQQRIVVYLDDLQARVDALTRLQVGAAAELDALLPAILDRAFKGELL